MAARKSRSRVRRAGSRRQVTRRTRRTTNRGNQWSSQELSFLRKYYRRNETKWVARQLGRTVYSVRYKACDLGIKKSRPSIWRGNRGVITGRKATSRRRSWNRPTWTASPRRQQRARRATPRRRPSRRTRSRRH